MSKRALREFYAAQIQDAKEKGVLLSLHLKATMMKVSDPIMFGHAVSVLFQGRLRRSTPPSSRSSASTRITASATSTRRSPSCRKRPARGDRSRHQGAYAARPELAMVNSDKGITNLHVPSDVIVDASMPAMIRESGKMWGRTASCTTPRRMIPDRCYARVYQAVIEDCKKHGAFDPTTMGSVPNVGLMAQKAEEYGSHDKTFEIAANGTVRVVDASGKVLLEQKVEAGDIFRMCQVKDAPDPGLGEARRHPRPAQQHARHLLAGQGPRPRCADHRQGRALSEGPRHQRPRHPHHDARGSDAVLAGAHPRRARTRFPSPATCCATT